MKKTFAIVTAIILSFCALFPVSAEAVTQSQKRVVYVASKLIPEAASDFVRDYFNKRMTAQDVCDATALTIDQVKAVRLCPAFTVEPLDTDMPNRYFFPVIYNDSYIATLEVYQTPDSSFACYIVREDPFIKALNTLSSTASSPIIFAVTKNAYFALDSKNKATLLQEFNPAAQRETANQKLAVQQMKRPIKTVLISAGTAYPEQISALPTRDKAGELTVINETDYSRYTSGNNGKRWRLSTPPVYISLASPYYLKRSTTSSYTVHNRTGREMLVSKDFILQKWNGKDWAACPEANGMSFNGAAMTVSPRGTRVLKADWVREGIKLEAGQYKLIKKLTVNKQQFTCEAVFVLE